MRDIAKELKIKRTESLKKQDLIYKILDQQAIEATEKKKNNPPEIRPQNPIPEKTVRKHEPGQRRGKRPRTVKPVTNRPVESVISVSPDDLKKPETAIIHERREQPPVVERTEDKPVPPAAPEPVREEVRQPRWKQDRKDNGRRDRDQRFMDNRFPKKEEKKPEVVENLLPLNGDEPLYESQRSQRTITC